MRAWVELFHQCRPFLVPPSHPPKIQGKPKKEGLPALVSADAGLMGKSFMKVLPIYFSPREDLNHGPQIILTDIYRGGARPRPPRRPSAFLPFRPSMEVNFVHDLSCWASRAEAAHLFKGRAGE